MRLVPLLGLAIGLVFAFIAWRRRRQFRARPYYHWFVFFSLAAVGLHQFEEYGWPGEFRDVFADLFEGPSAASVVPSTTALELLNTFGLTVVFGLVGWFGTRVTWLGLALLYTHMANGYFHLITSVTQWTLVPGVVTGTLLYLPLALLATRHAVRRHDVDDLQLMLALALGTLASLLPFLHVRIASALFGA